MTELNPLTSTLSPISAFTRVFDALWGRGSSPNALLLVCVMAGCVLIADAALAQPFGLSRASDAGGFAGYILAKQAEFYRMLSGTIRAAKTDGSAAYTLLGISFLYGIFHAAGPGHGKAVISSYLV